MDGLMLYLVFLIPPLVFGLVVAAIAVHSLFYNAFFEDPMSWGILGLTALGYAWRTSTRTIRARSNGK